MQANVHMVQSGLPRRHPGEIPFYIFCVILNLALLTVLIFFGEQIRALGENIHSPLVELISNAIWIALAIPIGRELLRAWTRADAILLSRKQFQRSMP